MSLATQGAASQEECVHREAGLYLPLVKPFFFWLRTRRYMLPGTAPALHYAVGSNAIHGPGGGCTGLLSQAGTGDILLYGISCLL